MKIIETNNDQWDIRENGTATIIAGLLISLSGIAGAGWVLMLAEDTSTWWALAGAGVFMLGMFIISSASNRHIILRRHGQTDIVTTKIIGGKEVRFSFDSTQISSVNLDTSDETIASNNSNGRTITHERTSVLYVGLRDSSRVMLGTSRRSSDGLSVNGFSITGVSKAPLIDEAQRIATFYGVQLNNLRGNELITDAIKIAAGGVMDDRQPGMSTDTRPLVRPRQMASAPPTQAPVSDLPTIDQELRR